MFERRVSLWVFLSVLVLSAPVQAQNWWTGGQVNTESGKITEVKQKRKVYLNVVFTTTETEINSQQEQALIRDLATRSLADYKGLELVGTPDQAELTVSIVASQTRGAGTATQHAFSANQDPNLETPLEVAVLVRGAMQRDGTYRARVVWGMSSSNIRGEPAPAAAFAISGFIDQLKKARGEKK